MLDEILKTNKTKICFWERICAGLYRLGDIEVNQIYHNQGTCEGQHMWHVIVDGKTLIKWSYLKDAKKSAHKLDWLANGRI